MRRRDAIKAMGALVGTAAYSRLLTGCVPGELTGESDAAITGYPANFGLLTTNTGCRTSWTTIVPGRFTSASSTSLFFYEGSTGYGEFWNTNGSGGLSGTAPVATYTAAQLGNRIWTHIIPGFWGPSGYMGLLLFDKTTGNAAFYDGSSSAHLTLLRSYSGWRTSWSTIVPGYFQAPQTWNAVQTSETYTDLFFYSPSESQAQVWTTDGTGAITLKNNITYNNVGTGWTHVIGGDFCANSDEDQYSDLIFYNAATGSWMLWYTRFWSSGAEFFAGSPSSGNLLPAGLTSLIPGNFGGTGGCDLALFTASTGAVSFRTLLGDTSPQLLEIETRTYPRTTASIVVPGNFWTPDPDEHWFFDGDNQNNEQLRSWRAAAGGFADLLFYNASTGVADAYFHEPLLPAPDPLVGYINGTTNHAGALVSSGSFLPGETISLHVSSQVGAYGITIRNANDPAGTVLATLAGLPTNPSPVAFSEGAYRDGTQWSAVASFVIPTMWSSGLYIARVAANSGGAFVELPFVVRAAASSTNTCLVVIADTTYEAYNDWGGRSVYGYSNVVDGEPATPTDFASRGAVYPQGGMRAPYAFTVSFDRPHDGRYETHGHRWTYWERPLVQWLAGQGLAHDVCTLRDLHFEPPASHYKLLAFSGHHEYWSRPARTNVETFVSNGGNTAFMSGNVCWWQVRISTDGKQMICYKNKTFDPLSTGAQANLTTVNWKDPPVSWPETSLTGVSYDPGSGPLVYSSPTPFVVAPKASSDLLLRGSGLVDGQSFGYLNGSSDTVVGSETDRRQPSTPGTFKLLATASINGYETGSMGYFPSASGTSRTITTATMNWTLGLTQDFTTWNAVDQITMNIFNDSMLGPDLAYRASVTASSSLEQYGFSLTNVTDGNRRTPYSSQIAENDSTKAVNHSEWVEIDLPSRMTFSTVVVYPRCDSPYVGAGWPIDFRIQVWNGTTWLDRVVVTGAPVPTAKRQIFSWGFSDTTDRIRLLATNLRVVVPADGYLLQLSQITVHA